jgi:uncharacterized protein YegP (UPF0339 family)
MAAKFEVYKDKGNKYRFRLKAANGEVIATGESYPTKAACLKGIASIKKSAPAAAIIDPEAEAEAKAKAKAKADKEKAAKAKKPAAKKAAAKKPAAK